MGFWPGEDYTIRVKGSAKDALRMLSANTLPGKPMLSPFRNYEGKSFAGQVTPDGFVVMPVPSRRNSFLPVIRGTVLEIGKDTEVKIEMRLNQSARTFIIVWMSGCAAFGLPILFHIQNILFNFGTLLPLVMPVFAYGMTQLYYRLSARQSKELLNTLLGAIQ